MVCILVPVSDTHAAGKTRSVGMLREALGVNGRAYVRQGYRWDAVIERYRSLIAAVAGA